LVTPKPSVLLWTARGGLVACALITAVFAFSPPKDGLHVTPWDKADHFCAFFAIMTAAMVSFPRQKLIWVAFWVSMSGAAIELIQGLPFVHRDCDVFDWLAENLAIGAVIGLVIATRIRSLLAESGTLSGAEQ
jgi:hypothetical protein